MLIWPLGLRELWVLELRDVNGVSEGWTRLGLDVGFWYLL